MYARWVRVRAHMHAHSSVLVNQPIRAVCACLRALLRLVTRVLLHAQALRSLQVACTLFPDPPALLLLFLQRLLCRVCARASRVRAGPRLVPRVGVGLAVDQEPGDLDVAAPNRVVERGAADLQTPAAISASLRAPHPSCRILREY